MERTTGFEPVLARWKPAVLAIDTMFARIKLDELIPKLLYE